MTRIGMILAKPFPPDIRVEKETKALIDAGFQVGLLARSSESTAPYCERTEDGLDIYRPVVTEEPIWSRQIKGITLHEKSWQKPLKQFLADFDPGVLHVHDFPMLNTVLQTASPLGIPVVADLHENMPAAYRIWRRGYPWPRRLKDSLFHNYRLWRWHEKRILPQCERIFVVVPEAAERLHRYGIPESRITIVSNTEDDTTFELQPPSRETQERYAPLWVISYVGGIGPHRGVDTAILAMPQVAQHVPHAHLLIVGARDNHQKHKLQKLARRCLVSKQVEIIGWQPFERVRDFVQVSAACLVPHSDSEHTNTTVPHKLFQYMIAGKPVVVSNVRPLKRIVEETKAGLVFAADDPGSLAQALIQLYEEYEMAHEYGANGRQAATGAYSWKHDARRLVNIYRVIEASN